LSAHEHPNPNPHDDPAASQVAMVGIVGGLIVLVLVVLLVGLYYGTESRVTSEVLAEQPALLAGRLFEQQRASLMAPPTWVDKEKRVARIPLDRAVELTIRNGGRGPASRPATASAGQPQVD
jgi:hypothetical protein